MDNNLPEDFDWQFYISFHADLLNAGIKTESQAVDHYIKYGKSEHRLYKPSLQYEIQQDINADNGHIPPYDIQIILFTQWYDDSETEAYRLQCLTNNVNNIHIDHIHIFCQVGSEKQLISYLPSLEKISISFIEDNLSYADWMDYANKHYTHTIKILANSDIYFDETISLIKKERFNYQTLFAITRKDLNKEGEIVDSYDYYEDHAHPTHPLYSQDCWIYFLPLRLPDLSAINYKLGYGNCDRLFKKYLETEKINFINLYPKINAIHIDYRKTKHRQSYDLNHTCGLNRVVSISDFLSDNDICYHHNLLESIALLVTGTEFTDGQYQYMISKILHSLQVSDINRFFAKRIDLNIVVPTSKNNTELSDTYSVLQEYFKSVSILPIDIPEYYDFYDKVDESCNLTYGYKSGPNYCFFKAFEKLNMYNTTLFLECDCALIGNWLGKLYNYCRFSDQFWISGSYYDGHNLEHYGHIVNQHLNGGSSLYATGNIGCQNFIQLCFKLLPLYVEKYSKGVPYDYCIYQIIEDYFNFDHLHRHIWQFIKRNYLHNNIILNYSTHKDIDIELEHMLKLYRPAIVHQKLHHYILNTNQALVVPEKFNAEFYSKKYPETIQYLINDTNLSFDQKMYHHYLSYGQYQNYSINY